MSITFDLEAGKTLKLLTAGKYCDKNIVVNATGGGVVSGFVPVSYIKSQKDGTTGGPYFDTGLVCTADMRIELTIRLLDTESDQKFFGTYDFSAKKGVAVGTYLGKWRIGAGTWEHNIIPATTEVTTITAEGNVWTINDETFTLNDPLNNYNSNILLCAIAHQGTLLQTETIEVMSYKHYKDGVLVRDFRPILRGSDNACTLYDYVECKALDNAGTGAFTGG